MNPHANLLLVCTTKVESQAILDVFKSASNKAPEAIPIADRMYHDLGFINNASVYMMQCEMGSMGLGSSLLTTGKGINALSPDAVVMVGIAFGVDAKKQSIGDVLISQQLMLYDLQRVGIKDNRPNLIPRGDRPHASPWLLDRFRNAEAHWNDSKIKVRIGLILSGDKLVDNIDFRQQLKDIEPEAIGGEMEGAGLYTACQDAKVDWILVKSICDWADGHKSYKKKEYQRLAAKNAASFVLHVLQQAPLKREGSIQGIATSELLDDRNKPVKVTILLDKDVHEFTPLEQDSFVFALSRIVNVDPDQIRILRVVRGSTIITIEMPEEASKTLRSLYLEQALRLEPSK